MNLDPFFLTITDHVPVVIASLLIAILGSYVVLDFAERVRFAREPMARWLWILAGAVTMGSGVWSMHFVGMAATAYPFEAAFEPGLTGISWLLAVLTAIFGLHVCGMRDRSPRMIALAAPLLGGATVVMHFVGMRALVVTPAPEYHAPWIIAAVLWVISGTAIMFTVLASQRELEGWRRVRRQGLAAVVLGASLTGMHYLAMASTDFAEGAVCLSADGLKSDQLGSVVASVSLTLLTLMLLMIALHRRAEQRSLAADRSLALAQDELRRVTLREPVTGLPNRLVFQDRLRQAESRCARDGGMFAVLFIDIDDFNTQSRSWNGTDGEVLLRAMAGVLKRSARACDTVASVGGDQFLMIVERLDGAEPVVRIAGQIFDALAQPIALPGSEVRLAVSIGISMYPADGPARSLVASASAAALKALADGGGCYRFFEPGMQADAQEKSEWLDDLRLAVATGQFELFYQPKIHASNGEIAGVEALLRWRHPSRGMVSPAVFIPLAEKFGLIGPLGGWVVEEACRQMRAWKDAGLEVRVAVNVSTHQLRLPAFSAGIGAALARHGINPALLTCELTESAAMGDIAVSLPILQQLEAMGVQISIDDFGTGYSSLSYLRRLPVRQLKVDRSFVNDLCDSEDARLVVAAIINLAHALRLEVVAEGVETAGQRHALAALGCDKFQGFLFARPMPAAEFELLLSRRRPLFPESAVLASPGLEERVPA